MLNNEFICWINGYLVLTDEDMLDRRQIKIIRNHANLVMDVARYLEPNIQQFLAFIEGAEGKYLDAVRCEAKALGF